MNNRFHRPHLIQTEIHADFRGSLSQTLDQRLEDYLHEKIVQTNLVKSNWMTFRGLHYQMPPFAQLKVVQVLKGMIKDVCVNMMEESDRNNGYGEYEVFTMIDDGKALIVPYGWAHGFYTASSEGSIVSYNLTQYWSKEHEMLVNIDSVNVELPHIIRNSRDMNAPLLNDIKTPWRTS